MYKLPSNTILKPLVALCGLSVWPSGLEDTFIFFSDDRRWEQWKRLCGRLYYRVWHESAGKTEQYQGIIDVAAVERSFGEPE